MSFFCLFPGRNSNICNPEYTSFNTINFSKLFGLQPAPYNFEKLRTLFNYFNRLSNLKGSVVIISLKHGLRLDIFLRKRFGRFLWFFRCVIVNPKWKKCRLDFSCKSLYLTVFVHLKNLRTFRIFTALQETVHV